MNELDFDYHRAAELGAAIKKPIKLNLIWPMAGRLNARMPWLSSGFFHCIIQNLDKVISKFKNDCIKWSALSHRKAFCPRETKIVTSFPFFWGLPGLLVVATVGWVGLSFAKLRWSWYFFLFWGIVIQKRCFKRQKEKAEKLRKSQEKGGPETKVCVCVCVCVCVSERDILIHKPYRYLKKFKDMGQLYWGGHWVCLKVNDAKKLKHESWWLWQLPSLTVYRHFLTDTVPPPAAMAWLFSTDPCGQKDPLEKGMATHSSILAWGFSWTEEPGGLQSLGLQRVGHNWMANTPVLPVYDRMLHPCRWQWP